MVAPRIEKIKVQKGCKGPFNVNLTVDIMFVTPNKITVPLNTIQLPSMIQDHIDQMNSGVFHFIIIPEPTGLVKVVIKSNIAFARGGAHLPIAHALRLLSTQELRFG